MAAKALPSQEALRQLLDYDPETGALIWRERGAEWFTDGVKQKAKDFAARWNSAYAGKPAISAFSEGYKTGTLLGRPVSAHRVIWAWWHGEEADNVDHINGDTSDNRLINLRSVTKADNARNHKLRRDNASGLVGIHRRGAGVWIVQIKGRHLGTFRCLGQAIKARKAAERRLGYHPNHGRAA